MEARGNGLAEAVPVSNDSASRPDRSDRPVWDAEQLRLAITAAGVALWSWNVDTNRFTMDETAFHLWGVPLSTSVTFDDLSSHIHPADRDRV
jgi:HWE histidine kinase/PAS fold